MNGSLNFLAKKEGTQQGQQHKPNTFSGGGSAQKFPPGHFERPGQNATHIKDRIGQGSQDEDNPRTPATHQIGQALIPFPVFQYRATAEAGQIAGHLTQRRAATGYHPHDVWIKDSPYRKNNGKTGSGQNKRGIPQQADNENAGVAVNGVLLNSVSDGENGNGNGDGKNNRQDSTGGLPPRTLFFRE